jgi:hypothetical protein
MMFCHLHYVVYGHFHILVELWKTKNTPFLYIPLEHLQQMTISSQYKKYTIYKGLWLLQQITNCPQYKSFKYPFRPEI